MSDPTVTAFLTKVLCKHGGRLPKNELSEFLHLSTKQIEQILQDEPQKFLQVGDLVLARSPVRTCTKYLKNEEKEECDKLHLCQDYLRGKCKRPRCPFSHDIFSDQNQKVLKANEISGLNEDEIKVLLLQNDNQLLPGVCWKYHRDSCNRGEDCWQLHICRFFILGECNRRACKRSHLLLEFGSDLLLTHHRIPEETIENFQMICTAKHDERVQTLRSKGKKDQEKGQPGAQKRRRGGRGGRGRPRDRKKVDPQDGAQSQSQGPQEGRGGFHSQGRSDSRPEPESGESHHYCSGEEEEDDSEEALRNRILNDWFNSPPEKSSDRGASLPKISARWSSSDQRKMPSETRHSTLTVYRSNLEDSMDNLQFTLPVTSTQPGLPSAHKPKPIAVGPVNPPSTSTSGTGKPIHLPTKGPSIAASVKLVSPTVVNPLTAPVPFTRPSKLVDSPTKSPSFPQQKPLTPTTSSYSAQPVVTTIKPVSYSAASPSSAPSTSYARLVDSSAKGQSVQWVKPVQPQPATAPSSAESNKVPEICLSNLWKYCNLGGRCPDMHYYLPYRWQIYKGTDWEDVSNMDEIEKSYCDPSADRIGSIDFVTMRSGVHPVRRLSTVSSVTKPPGYVLTTEWLWYWKDENDIWIQYGHSDMKQVISSILSTDLENIYLSDPIAVHSVTGGINSYQIDFPEMKQKNVLYKTEKNVRRRPKYRSCENVKSLRGSTKSPTPQPPPAAAVSPLKTAPPPLKTAPPPLKTAPPPLKTDIYPSTWDASALPEIGCQRILIPDTSREFSEIVSSFTKTVSGYMVRKLWRLQNPSLWQVFQRQKEEMKKLNQGQDVKELRLFHGAVPSHVHIIYNESFDWRICGFHGHGYGQGNYFARDACYANNYSVPQPDGKQSMFVARVLVGDYVKGNQQMTQPPPRPGMNTRYYDSCVNNILNPAIFVVFKKHQVYPEYLLEYEEQKKSCVIC
ncbi:zinc finger CCCH-type antiviral protein 1-like [Hyla sarda]|uniref:zinc finger CCCH-type antiviral protein 1-like n=1 Tax=Hyla sarda TaxID=327740 RepID=UPI0024C3A13F|nr:zinc finger CCCH-type antiviral protein 1-like [Hyla sarda]